MRKRHEKEIEELQNNCKHEKISDWMDHYWAPGHWGGKVKVCEFCNEIIEKQKPDYIIPSTISTGKGEWNESL